MNIPSGVVKKNIGLVLGTALWGWGVEKREAFSMLDKFAELGGHLIDTAVNYPINKNADDFGRALAWVCEWVNSNQKLEVLIKLGGVNNMGGPESDLSKDNILSSVDEYASLLGESLKVIAVHWDNRDESDLEQVELTLDAFRMLCAKNFQIGFSGVKHPEIYQRLAPDLGCQWIVQVKENFANQMARCKYQQIFPDATYIAYGINMGGLKKGRAEENSSVSLRGINDTEGWGERLSRLLDSKIGLEPQPNNFNDLALMRVYSETALDGAIIGPRNTQQLVDSMTFWERLKGESSPSNKSSLAQI